MTTQKGEKNEFLKIKLIKKYMTNFYFSLTSLHVLFLFFFYGDNSYLKQILKLTITTINHKK